MAEVRKDLPNVETIFFSSITMTGITELKDVLWKALNS